MKPYRQAEEILSMAADFHRMLADRYEELRQEADREVVRQLLEYMGRHQRRMQEGLSQFSAGGGENIGKTWIQYVPEVDRLDVGEIALSPGMSLKEVVAASMEWYGRLTAFYRAVAQNPAAPPEVREMFQKLVTQQEREKGKLAHAAEQLERT